MISIVRTVLGTAAAVAVVAGTAGCSCSVGVNSPRTVSKADVAQQIATKMGDPGKSRSVTCPGDLVAKVGAQLECEMTVDDATYNVNVNVTSVEGNDVKFDMVETVDKDQVAHIISNHLYQQVGSRPDALTCPEDLKGYRGATLRCQLTDGTKKYGIDVIVNSVVDGKVDFDYQVDDHPE
ncbi:DUF4333 domain-containing protein [Mycobacterium sp.]|uniref:DUF4333 domain-containing protein n=1 Tax=Mycobacterium sp. TaxID=1785 RepID=UPI003A89B2D0